MPARHGSNPGQYLLTEAVQHIPGLRLQQAVTLQAGHLTVQVVALIGDQLAVVHLQRQQVAAAVGQPVDPGLSRRTAAMR